MAPNRHPGTPGKHPAAFQEQSRNAPERPLLVNFKRHERARAPFGPKDWQLLTWLKPKQALSRAWNRRRPGTRSCATLGAEGVALRAMPLAPRAATEGVSTSVDSNPCAGIFTQTVQTPGAAAAFTFEA
eukprot:6366182-Alexandrium_andersonii.AAC.1